MMKLGACAGGGGGGGKELPLPWRLRSGSGGQRVFVWIVLVCCSPILVPLVCLSLPFVFIIFLCIRSDAETELAEDFVDEQYKKKEKTNKVSVGDSSVLLHRYLEDQLKLVLESDTCKFMLEI